MGIVEAVPFAVGADGEENVGAASILDTESHHRALLVLDNVSSIVEHRDHWNRQARMRNIGGERIVDFRWHRSPTL